MIRTELIYNVIIEISQGVVAKLNQQIEITGTRKERVSKAVVKASKDSGWNTKTTYVKVNNDIANGWSRWKQEAYNETFAISAHAIKISVRK